jgi:hypothetical protein
MPMSIKNPEVERLAEELSRLTKSSKTEVIRQALREKKERLEVAGSAAAKVSGQPLLFVGDDFAGTDVLAA